MELAAFQSARKLIELLFAKKEATSLQCLSGFKEAEVIGKKLSVVFTWPEQAVALAMHTDVSLVDAIQTWKRDAQTALKLKSQSNTTFVALDTEDSGFSETLIGVVGLPKSQPVPSNPTVILLISAREWLRSDAEVNELARALSRVAKQDSRGACDFGGEINKTAEDHQPQYGAAPHQGELQLLQEALLVASSDISRLTLRVQELEAELSRYAGKSPFTHFFHLLFDGIQRKVESVLRRLMRDSDFALLRDSELFDAEWYSDRFPDVAAGSMDPEMHFLLHGGFEGRPASLHFDTASYLIMNPDVRRSALNPLIHFIRRGHRQGRSAMTLLGDKIEAKISDSLIEDADQRDK